MDCKELNTALSILHSKLPEVTDWRSCQIDLSNPVPPPEPLIIQTDSGITLLSRRNISTIAAAAKVGKTFLVSALAASGLSNEGFLGLHSPKEIKVLFVDTEMDNSDTQQVAIRVHKIVGYPTNRNVDSFTVLNLRAQSNIERLAIVEVAIKEIHPDLVLLDGVVDVCQGSFNEVEPSLQITTRLAQLSTEYDCHICTCLHVNKGTQELRGHLGAFLRQKGELTLLLSKKNEETPYIEVKPIDSRRRAIDEFCFRINNEGLPELYQPVPKPSKSPKLDKLFAEIIPLPNSMSYADLKRKVMEVANVKESMAEKRISQAIKSRIIEKSTVGLYHLPQPDLQNEPQPF